MIREATHNDLSFCLDAGMVKNTGLDIKNIKKPMICIEQNGLRMCALVYTLESYAEVHLITPRESAIKSRELAKELINYLAELGIKIIFTKIGKKFKRAENMAKKLGFENIGCDIWALKLQF